MAKLVIIDDDDGFRNTLVRMVRSVGHTATSASDGVEGVAAVRAASPDLVITDLIMPDQDGLETILQLKDEAPDLPIVAMSGDFSSPGLLGRLEFAQALGADAMLEKPFDLFGLLRVIDSLLAAGPAAASH
jgi:CheY-like chemotaxis protein